MTQSDDSSSARPAHTSVLHGVLKGSVAGMTEVMIDHPLWSIKTRLQRGDAFTLHPRLLYRGILTNASSMVPVTAIQVGLDRSIRAVFYHGVTDISDTERLVTAFTAGVGSSFVSCPTEMIMTRQSRTGISPLVARRQLIAEGGWRCLWTALPATGMREGVFTAFFLAVTPMLKKKLETHALGEHASAVAAGMSAGVGAAVVSQLFDTVKTAQQTTQTGFQASARRIYASHGFPGFFKGGLPRGLNVMSALTIMSYVNDKMDQWLADPLQDSDAFPEQNLQKVKR